MKVTTELLQENQACLESIEKFIEHFPKGEAEYQDVLDKLAELNDASNANWLLKTIGKIAMEIPKKNKVLFVLSFSCGTRVVVAVS